MAARKRVVPPGGTLSDTLTDPPDQNPPVGSEAPSDVPPPKKPRKKRKDAGKPRDKSERGSGAQVDDDDHQPVTLEATIGMCVVLCGTLSAIVDESFDPFKPGTMEPDPRIVEGSKQMLPWLVKYGGSMAAIAPWMGLFMGAFTVIGPGLPATMEIVAGIKEPRIFREKAGSRVVVVEPERGAA